MTQRRSLDETDLEIIRILQTDGSTSKAEIARSVNMTPTAVFERLRKLEDRGVIKGYSVQLDPEAVGLPLLAFVFVSELKPVNSGVTGAKLATLTNVEEVHRVTGRDCFLVKIRAADTAGLKAALDQINGLPSVGAVETSVVLETFLERPTQADAALP